MPDENNLSANLVPSINEGFTQGGDLILQSTDGIDFSVHHVLLSLASPVFSELLQLGNRNQTVRFSENAEILALMLNFIYPRPTPTISSTEVLNEALRVANKYQIDSMKTRLREQLVLVDSPVSVYSSPLSALYIASTHGLTTEAELAARLASQQYDFGKGQDLKKLLDAASLPATAALVKLTGIPLVKTRVLTEVLFHFERSPMTIHDNSGLIDALLCWHCKGIHRGMKRPSPPEWQARWAHWVLDEIKDRRIAEWKGYFSHSNFNRSFYQPHLPASFRSYEYYVTAPHCECARFIAQSAAKFQAWADRVYEHLESRVSFIAELEAQIMVLGPEVKE